MKRVIFGFKGKVLSDEERAFFLEHKPAGFIIFKRNIESKDQLKELCSSLQALFPEREVLILIDQEGGRVQRLTEPHTEKYPAPLSFTKLIEDIGLPGALEQCYRSNLKMAIELSECGVNVNCTPVADLLHEGADNIIGDRSFGSDPDIVIQFCREVIRAHCDAGVRPIIKHIPGHGRAKCDSHLSLPTVDASVEEMATTDFKVFKELANLSPFAMTAHIVYKCIDEELPATHSKKCMNFIREGIGFSGGIITDCITMEALSGTFGERASRSLEAGCDYVLHCSGDMPQMVEVVGGL